MSSRTFSGPLYLVTGPNSGLGQYLCKSLNARWTLSSGDSITLEKSQIAETVLIHSGFRRIAPNSPALVSDLERNVLDTRELAQAGFKRVIYTSTIDVYPLIDQVLDERYCIANADLRSVYAYQKKICESLINESNENALILRLPMLVGDEGKPNTITKIMAGENLSLSRASSINAITYEHVSSFIKEAEKIDATGIYNLVASKNAFIDEVVDAFGSKSKFGSFKYETPLLDNDKAQLLLPSLSASTIEILSDWHKSV